MFKCKARESEIKRPKAAEQSFNKEILLLGEIAFVLCSITSQRTGTKPEPETTALLSALERVYRGQQQSQTTREEKK